MAALLMKAGSFLDFVEVKESRRNDPDRTERERDQQPSSGSASRETASPQWRVGFAAFA